ncbi:hypothetical protein NAEGRDRAFT_58724 [Naegleria gruberi]|uniref:Dynamin N-terminal domain-containing protein n=1 Tax=Naegleria gruberi TaxID=5762 RepID=D2VN32_NAEGR|nr:uncharacterized protein NAEGRDRAFT_58724 [Naegleria gruberi]EFC41850.1 hypothetical protein NAEGRDRAFT_58724 [Naegleria gruberi]|eukprot:XP_002674594.1 hypothetical protein NAEGRDRAFT_58724 [Naegleria gruberi strain NEG-M]
MNSYHQQFMKKLKESNDQLENTTKKLLEQQKSQLNDLFKMRDLLLNVHKSKVNKTTNDSLEKMEKIINTEEENPKPIVVAFLGNAGVGKSSFINDMIGGQLLPSSSGRIHVTKALCHLSYSNNITMEPVLCSEDEVKERCAETHYDYGSIKPVSIVSKVTEYKTIQDLTTAMVTFQNQMTESDVYRIKLIRVKVPLPKIKSKFEVIDVPGINSGTLSGIFERMALEACILSDRILLFPNSFRSEIPTDVFEFVRKIFSDPIIQKNPKTFSFCHGGRSFQEADAHKEYLDCLHDYNISKIHVSFCQLLSNYFDFKFDDIPKAPNEKPVNDQIVFVENKKVVLELLKDNFVSFPIPHNKSKSLTHEINITQLYFDIMLKKDRLILVGRMIQSLRELALLCIPNLLFKSKFQTAKSNQDNNVEIMDGCNEVVHDIVRKMQKVLKKRGGFKKSNVKFPTNFLLDVLSSEVVKNFKEKEHTLIQNQLALMEKHIKLLGSIHLIKSQSGDAEQDLKNFSEQVLPLFDLNHKDHITLATEMKGVLNDLFKSFILERNFEYEHKFDINFCDVRRDEHNSGVLKLPNRMFSSVEDMTSAKIVSNGDSLTKANKYRNDKSEMQVRKLESSVLLPASSQNIMEINIRKDKIIEIEGGDQSFDSFKSMLPSSTLLNHHAKTRIAPTFFLSLDGTCPNLAFNSCWVNYTSESLVIIVTPHEYVDNFVDLVQQHNENDQHRVMILSVSVENELYSEGSLMNAVFDFSSYFDFPIIHLVKLNVKNIYEYVSPLKEYVHNEWTPIRYFRSSEAIVYNEINSLSDDKKQEIAKKFVTSANDIIYKNSLRSDERINDLSSHYNAKEALADVEGFVDYLRLIDSKVNGNLEKNFKQSFFSKNKARVGCWDGLTRNIDRNKIYSRNGYNYMISNYATAIETYFMQALDKIRPVSDIKFTQDLPKEGYQTIENGFDSKMISFRTNMLANGVGGFIHFGFKYDLNRYEKMKQKQQTPKRKKSTKKNNFTSRKKRK